jgi:hypothetical protein
MANSKLDTADVKDGAMRDAGLAVPDTFKGLSRVLKEIYEDLVRGGTTVLKKERLSPRLFL